MWRMLLAACLLPPLLTVALLLAVGIGRAQPTATLLTNLDTCHLPCWNGIRPGETEVGAADRILTEQGFRVSLDNPRQNYTNYAPANAISICGVKLYYEAGIARGLVLTPCERI